MWLRETIYDGLSLPSSLHPYNLQSWFSIILTTKSHLSHSDKRYPAKNLSRVTSLFFTDLLGNKYEESNKLKAFLVYLKNDADNNESVM